MTVQTNQNSIDRGSERVVLERRFEDLGWGVLLVTIGTIWLVPEKHVPHGSWLIAAGLILLGLNAARFFRGISMSGFSLVVGVLALIAGLGEFFGIGVPIFPIALIVIGVCSLLKPLLEKNRRVNSVEHTPCCGPQPTSGVSHA
jgi:hypothetical protein